jgi:PST family polysaccharide transporter
MSVLDTPQATLKDRVVRGVFWTSMDTWGRQALAFIIYAALARLVGPESFGIVALGVVYVAFVEIFVTQGFSTSLVQRKNLDDGHLDSAFWISITMATTLTVATVLFAERVATIFAEPRLASVLRWLSLSLILMALSAVPQAALTRAMAFRALAGRSFLATLTGGIVGLAMAWHEFGVWSLVAQQLFGAAAATAVLWWATEWRPSFPPSWRHVRDLYGFALSIAGNNILWFCTQRTDQTLIGYGFGASALGPYALATRCIQLMMDAVAVPMQVVALPAFSRIQDERERLLNAFYRMTEVAAVIAVPAFSGIAVLAPTLVPVVFGPSWSSTVPLLQALAIFGLLRIPVSFGHPLILAIGRPGVYFALFVLQTVLTVLLCLLAILWSPLVVAAAVSLSMAINSAIFLIVVRRLAGISIRMLASSLWAPALASAVMSAAVLVFQHFARETLGDLLTVVGGVVLGAGVYGGGIVVLRPELIRELSQTVLTRTRLPRASDL